MCVCIYIYIHEYISFRHPVCVFVCIYIFMSIYVFATRYVCLNIYIYVHKWICTLHFYICRYTCISVCGICIKRNMRDAIMMDKTGSVCMCVCLCIYIYIRTFLYMRIYMYLYTRYLHTATHAQRHSDWEYRLYMYVCLFMYICIYVHFYICVYTCICICGTCIQRHMRDAIVIENKSTNIGLPGNSPKVSFMVI